MGLISDFNTALELWFNAHGVPNLNVVEGEDFCFYYNQQNIIQWGMVQQIDIDNQFAQFFEEYGCKTYTTNTFIESLLHEVGHYMTMSNFTEKEWNRDNNAKYKKHKNTKASGIALNYWYWELPTEFAANLWAINFLNDHLDWAIELIDLCCKHLTKIFNDENIMEQLEDWMDDAENGIDEPLVIIEDEEDY